MNPAPASTATTDATIQPVRRAPRSSIVQPPSATAANTIIASAATAR